MTAPGEAIVESVESVKKYRSKQGGGGREAECEAGEAEGEQAHEARGDELSGNPTRWRHGTGRGEREREAQHEARSAI